jgi:hypothetical protein
MSEQANPSPAAYSDAYPSAAPLAFLSAAIAVAGLAAGLYLVGETAAVQQRLWAFAFPPVVALAASAWQVARVYRAFPLGQGPGQEQGVSLRKLFRSVAGICLTTGFACGIFVVLWYRWFFPEVMEARLAEAERQMTEDGFSPGDISEHLHRSRVVLYGPLGMFLGGLIWSVVSLLPASLLVLFSRR